MSVFVERSLFTEDERAEYKYDERMLILKVERGSPTERLDLYNQLLDFWRGKKAVFLTRAADRKGEVL